MKILVIYDILLHYRLPLFNLLNFNHDVTVVHSGENDISKQNSFKEIAIPRIRIGPLYFQKGLLKIIQGGNYDIIIGFLDVRWLSTLLSFFLYKSRIKYIFWGPWLTKSKLANLLRIKLVRYSLATIFYTEESRKQFVENDIDPNKLFVANNTFDVGERIKAFQHKAKFRLLFVGTLNRRKENIILITAFNNIMKDIGQHIILTFIGDGEEFDELCNYVKRLNISNRVEFLGRINDPQRLRKYYLESIVSVSFGQAGLSVLQSFGFGVPFLTKKNAISGGEKYNIKHNFNGILCEDNISSLEAHLKYLCQNINFALELGKNAYQYYSDHCTIEKMAKGFQDAIEYVSKK